MTIQEQLHNEARRRVETTLVAFAEQIKGAPIAKLSEQLGVSVYAAEVPGLLSCLSEYFKYGQTPHLTAPDSTGADLIERVEAMLTKRVVDAAIKENP